MANKKAFPPQKMNSREEAQRFVKNGIKAVQKSAKSVAKKVKK